MNKQKTNNHEQKTVVEVGILLDKPIKYYQKMLEAKGLKKVFEVKTHDVYYSDANFDNLTENQIKSRCVRFRSCKKPGEFFKATKYKVENYQIFDSDTTKKIELSKKELPSAVESLEKAGFRKVFDTTKKDYHYSRNDMTSRIQLQEIEGIGLMVYYDNKTLYHLPEAEQRKALIQELNGFGFEIGEDTLGLDKLRSLYFGENKYSQNQNG